MTRALRICLAASGGGHVRQLLDLEPVWGSRDYVFVTEDTALGRSLAKDHPVRFVPHFALGQARVGQKWRMLTGALRNLTRSWRIVAETKPDIVISTGAGAVFWVALFARLRGAKFVLIESFARFDGPSKFGRLASPIATHRVAQSAALRKHWPDAQIFDPFRILDEQAPPKQPLVFATVGATLGFPRLVESVLALKASGRLPEDVLLQTGDDWTRPIDMPGVTAVPSLGFDELQAMLRDAAIVITHGGTGSLITALRAGCRVVAMPRRADLGEHYDAHQEEIVSAFEARGLLVSVTDEATLGDAIDTARTREPILATTDPRALRDWLTRLLDDLAARTRR